MGTNTLTDKVTGATIAPSYFNDIHTAAKGDWVPRNSSGVPEDLAGRLGTASLRWEEVHTQSLTLNGQTVTLSEVQTQSFKVESGRTHSTHNGPRYLIPDGTTDEVTIKAGGANPDLQLVVDGEPVTVSADITVSGLTLAPSSTNTALVNDTDLADQEYTKIAGEYPVVINNNFKDRQFGLDTMGANFSAQIGRRQFFQVNNGSTTEIFFGLLQANTVDDCLRGFGYDSSENDQGRIAFSNNDTVTILSGNWIFLDQNGSTAFATVYEPIFGGDEPASPSTNQYWFDYATDSWYRYNGSTWDAVARALLGVAICNSTACIAASCEPFFFSPDDFCNMTVYRASATTATQQKRDASVSVMGKMLRFSGVRHSWDMAADLDSGLTEAASTIYYLYMTDEGRPVISSVYPRQLDWRRGEYHPHKPWRAIGQLYNNSSSDIEGVSCFQEADNIRLKTISGLGSTNTAQLIYSTVDIENGGSFRTYSSATLGSHFEVLRGCRVGIVLDVNQNGGGGFDTGGGITINGHSGTSTTPTDANTMLAMVNDNGSGSTTELEHCTVSWAGFLPMGTTVHAQYFDTTIGSFVSFFNIEKLADLAAGGK